MSHLQKTASINPVFGVNSGEFYYPKQLIGLLLSAYFLLFIYPKTGLDQTLIAPYFDAATNSFPLKNQVFLEQFMHTGLKYCMVLVAISSLLAGLQANIHAASRASFFARINLLFKNPYFLAFIGMVVSTSAVSFLKSISMHGCPKDLIMYGGKLPLFALFEHLPAG
jgi:membrane-associated PAP2 superfamily phosphatase